VPYLGLSFKLRRESECPSGSMTEASGPSIMVQCHSIIGGWVEKGRLTKLHRTEDSSVLFRSPSWAIQGGRLGEIIPGGGLLGEGAS
jgi:hypothetical protein